MSGIDLEHLADGMSSPFWTWFKQQVDNEWGKNGERFEQAVHLAASKRDLESHTYLNMVILARQEIQKLMAIPSDELSRLRGAQAAGRQVPTESRRGPGL